MQYLITYLFWQNMALRLQFPLKETKYHLKQIDAKLKSKQATPLDYSDLLLECVKDYRKFKHLLND